MIYYDVICVMGKIHIMSKCIRNAIHNQIISVLLSTTFHLSCWIHTPKSHNKINKAPHPACGARMQWPTLLDSKSWMLVWDENDEMISNISII